MNEFAEPRTAVDAEAGTEHEVLGDDSRRLVRDLRPAPLRWICAIDIFVSAADGSSTQVVQAKARATGVLIGPCHVLTARHVFDDTTAVIGRREVAAKVAYVRVSPGRNGDNTRHPFGQAKSVKVLRRSSRNQHLDYALVVLDRELALESPKALGGRLGYWGEDPRVAELRALPAKDLAGQTLTLIGYPGDRCGERPLAARDMAACLRDEPDRWASTAWRSGGVLQLVGNTGIVEHQADSFGGQSGAPLCLTVGGVPHLVAVHHGPGNRIGRQPLQWNRGALVRAQMLADLAAWINAAARRPWAEVRDGRLVFLPRSAGEAPEAGFEEAFEAESPTAFEEALEAESEAEFETEPDLAFEEEFEDADLEHLGVLEHQIPPAPAAAPTIGFEFDLNHGFERKVVDAMGLGAPPGWRWPFEGAPATDHAGRDGAGRLADGFVVKMDAVRLEIATVPVRLDDDAEFRTLVANVVAFGRELQAAEKTLQRDTPVPGVQGRPLLLHHPRTVVNQADAGSPGGLKTRREPVPLVIHRLSGRYPTQTALWAAPQATLTLPLAEFGKLVWEIHRTMGAAPGVALTGPASARLGLRDDLAWKALKIAMAERKRRVGKPLADGTVVTEAMFSRALTSALTILLMYMLTGTDVDPRDAAAKEFYAKGSLPLNLKTPLWAIHRHALNDDERRLLRALYTGPGQRAALFALVPRRPPGESATPLFPARTDGGLRVVFAAPPTWGTLVDAFADEQPIRVTEANSLHKKGHKPGDEILIAPLSSKIDWDKTAPRIAVELRRIGFAPVGLAHWAGLMDRVRALARRLNP